MKPSEDIKAKMIEHDRKFKDDNPWFFTDHGYWPDFKFQALMEWLDENWSKK